jgi:hypothetical protein
MIYMGLRHTREVKQTAAAEAPGISQSRVSDPIRGKFEKFSLDMLITLAMRAVNKIELMLAARVQCAQEAGHEINAKQAIAQAPVKPDAQRRTGIPGKGTTVRNDLR